MGWGGPCGGRATATQGLSRRPDAVRGVAGSSSPVPPPAAKARPCWSRRRANLLNSPAPMRRARAALPGPAERARIRPVDPNTFARRLFSSLEEKSRSTRFVFSTLRLSRRKLKSWYGRRKLKSWYGFQLATVARSEATVARSEGRARPPWSPLPSPPALDPCLPQLPSPRSPPIRGAEVEKFLAAAAAAAAGTAVSVWGASRGWRCGRAASRLMVWMMTRTLVIIVITMTTMTTMMITMMMRTTTTTVMMKAGLGFGPAWRGACGIIGIESR